MQRTLTGSRERILWLALGAGCVAPALGDYAGGHVSLGVVASASTALLVALVGLSVASTAIRYGVGPGILSRAAFGTRPAMVVHLLRYGAHVAWTSAHMVPLVDWLSKLTDASLRAFGPSFDLEWTGTEAQLRYLVVALVSALLGWTARGRIRRSRKMGWFALAVAIAGIGALSYALVWRGVPVLPPARPFAIGHLPIGFADALMLVWAVPEWVRYRDRHAGMARPLLRASVSAGTLAFVLLFVSGVALALRGRSDGSLISDATGVFGLGFGWAAAGVELAVLFMVLPMFGVLPASMALCTAFPKARYSYVAYATAVVAAVLAMIVSPPLWITALLLPPLGALIVDEQLVRRRTVRVLEDLYTTIPVRIVPFATMLAGCAIVVTQRKHLALALPGATLLAMTGCALGNLRMPIRKARRRHRRDGGASNWGEPLPLGEHDWAQGDETRVSDKAKT